MELKTSAQQRGQGVLKEHWRRGEEQGAELVHEPSVNKWQEDQQQAGDKPLPEVGRSEGGRLQGPVPEHCRQLCSVEEQRVNHHNMLTEAAS
jgi:hypothetical protein